MWDTLLFLLPVSGIHVVVPAAALYLLLPPGPRCAACHRDTVPLRMSRPGRACARLLRGRLQHRWCLWCGWHGLTRGASGGAAADGGNALTGSQRQDRHEGA